MASRLDHCRVSGYSTRAVRIARIYNSNPPSYPPNLLKKKSYFLRLFSVCFVSTNWIALLQTLSPQEKHFFLLPVPQSSVNCISLCMRADVAVHTYRLTSRIYSSSTHGSIYLYNTFGFLCVSLYTLMLYMSDRERRHVGIQTTLMFGLNMTTTIQFVGLQQKQLVCCSPSTYLLIPNVQVCRTR